jgi:hypothetical protein
MNTAPLFRQQPKAGTPSPLGQVKVLGRGFDGYYQNRFNLIFFYFPELQ